MPELEEFAEALLDQIAVETDEEKVIADLVEKIDSDSPFDVKFEPLEEAAKKFFAPMGKKMSEFTGLDCSSTVLKFAGLREFKALKGRKVIANGDSRQYIDRLFSAVSILCAGGGFRTQTSNYEYCPTRGGWHSRPG